MKTTKKMFKIGTSKCIVLPKIWLDKFDIEFDKVEIDLQEKEIIIKPQGEQEGKYAE